PCFRPDRCRQYSTDLPEGGAHRGYVPGRTHPHRGYPPVPPRRPAVAWPPAAKRTSETSIFPPVVSGAEHLLQGAQQAFDPGVGDAIVQRPGLAPESQDRKSTRLTPVT